MLIYWRKFVICNLTNNLPELSKVKTTVYGLRILRTGSIFGRVSRSLVSQRRSPWSVTASVQIMKIAMYFFAGSDRSCRRHGHLSGPVKRSLKWVCAGLLVVLSLPLFASNPTSPQNLRSSVYSATSAELFWNASTDADGVAGYRVYISGTLFRQVPGASLYIDVLHPGKRYDFQVSAVDRKGNESKWTAIHTLVARGSARALTNQNPLVTFSPVEPVVITPVTESAAGEVIVDAPAATQAAQPTAVQATTEEVMSVEAEPQLLAIQPPVNLRAVGQTDSSVSLDWQPASNSVTTAGYNLYLGNSYITTTRQPAFTVQGLDADSSYRLFVTAFDFNGNFSTRSNELLLETLPAGLAPVALIPAATESVTGESVLALAEEEADVAVTNDVVVETELSATDDVVNTTDVADTADATDVADTADATDVEPAENQVEEISTDSESDDAIPAPVPAPILIDRDDFFGHILETDTEDAEAGAAPTTPKHLRANLIGNDWVELNWAPANDDGEVVEYRIHRDDGVVYSISSMDESGDVETSQTLQNFWNTTTYTDCNFTHVSACNANQTTPEVGALHTYRVSAIDNQGNESAMSDPLTVKMHEEQGAEIQPFVDPYLDGNDEFLYVTDLSNTENFIDQFELVFADEFQGEDIDPEKWSTRLTWNQADNVINGEMQYFVDIQNYPEFGYDPFILNGETLTIAAIPTPPELSERALGQPFLSGAISTHEMRSGQLDSEGSLISDKFATTYGYVEGRIRVGQVSGMLTSFYLFRRWAGEHAPEIDIVEYLGENPYGDEKAFQTYHYRDVSHNEILSSPTMQYPRDDGTLGDEIDLDGFHTYSVLWEPSLVIWYINGQEVQRLTGRQVGRQSMNIIVYLVTGSAWAPRPADNAPFPLEIEVDYIRAYKRRPWSGDSGS